jgi:hypothetical protein
MNERMREIIRRYSVNRDFQPLDIIEELTARGLFEPLGRHDTAAVPWTPTVDEYLACRHSQNGLARSRMGATAAAFDNEVRALLDELSSDGTLDMAAGGVPLELTAWVAWGKPLPAEAAG